jgi:hypothetical protein
MPASGSAPAGLLMRRIIGLDGLPSTFNIEQLTIQ